MLVFLSGPFLCPTSVILWPLQTDIERSVFGLSFLGYCRKMAEQHGGLYGRGPAPNVDSEARSDNLMVSV